MDNSPVWDAACWPSVTADVRRRHPPPRPAARRRAEHRPSNAEYGKYLYLAARYRDHRCDDRDADYPFLLEDPALNALWVLSELALAEIAGELGDSGRRHQTAPPR